MAGAREGNGGESGFDTGHNPAWRILRIMSEFVEGFTFLASIERSVTIFGSARLAEDNPYYQMARQLAARLAQLGYAIVTGGGPGIMQAANQGAAEVGGASIGLNIQLPLEQRANPYVKEGMSFHYFFSRKVMLDFSATAYILFPGGYGTLDEFFELITLTQTGKIDRTIPIVLIGSSYWEPLITWMAAELRDRLHTIAPDDLDIWTLTDDLDEAVRIVVAGMEAQARRRTADDMLRQATRPMSRTEQ
jgi:uncharacterized protein (TIGR00730 family)